MRLSVRMQARSITLRNSRTLPVHAACCSMRSACGGDALDRTVHLGRELADERRREIRDVLAPVSQRRDVKLDRAEAEVEIAAELSRAPTRSAGRGWSQRRRTRRRLRASSEPTRWTSPYSTARSIFACSVSGSSPISSRKIVPESRVLEQADLGVRRAGERSAHVAEELALEQRFDDRGAVHRDETSILARPKTMERFRDQFLAGAGFSGDEHRARVRREAADRVEELLHAGAAPDEAVELELASDVGVDTQQCLAALEALAHRDQQLAQAIDVERLRDVVERTRLDGFDGGVDRSRVGHQDDLRLRIGRLDLAQDAQAVDARQPHVHDRAVRADDRQWLSARHDRPTPGRR